MIMIYTGNIGTGKTLSMARLVACNPNTHFFTNFKLQNLDNWELLKKEDFLLYEPRKNGDLEPVGVNWDFWNDALKKYAHFSIMIDEMHNFVSSRQSMSKRNVLMSRWISQARKILGESESNNFIASTQFFRKIDIDFRDIAHMIVKCRKVVFKKKVFIINYVWNDPACFEAGFPHDFKYGFSAEKYFRNYDTRETVRFGDE